MIERNPSAEWGPQLQRYLVSVEARDEADATRRIEMALQNHGTYNHFSAQRSEYRAAF